MIFTDDISDGIQRIMLVKSILFRAYLFQWHDTEMEFFLKSKKK